MKPLRWCSGLAIVAAAHAALNAALLRRPADRPSRVSVPVSVLLPVRDEAARLAPCLRALLVQEAVPDLEIVVLDDGSSDGSAELARLIAGDDKRVRVLLAAPPPDGWLGKPHACQQLADTANPASEVLIFVDADVVLAPLAVASTVDCLFAAGLDLVSPYPRQLATGVGQRLVQPLLQWSWLTFLPLRLAERSTRRSLSVANGQLLGVRRSAYDRAGGHAAVRGEILDDLALIRAVKAAGGRGGVVDGTGLAVCTMYGSWPELVDGYSKSLWAAFGSPRRGLVVALGLTAVYVFPALAALAGSTTGFVGYLAGVTSRVVAARRTGGRVWPDPLAHPASVVLFGWLTARSVWCHSRGELTWKGRRLP